MQSNNKNKNIVASILWFILGFVAISLISTQVITMDRYGLVTLYLLAVTISLVAYFRKELTEVVQGTKWYEAIILIGTSLLIHGATSYLVITYLNQPTWPFDSRGASFLLMNGYYVWTKPIDVFVQQVLINLLVLRLKNLGMVLNQITQLFVIGFGSIHIFQTLRTDLLVGLTYTAVAIIFSFVFPRMILRVSNGYIYNFMIHLAVYNIAAILAWTLY